MSVDVSAMQPGMQGMPPMGRGGPPPMQGPPPGMMRGGNYLLSLPPSGRDKTYVGNSH
jgi:hypothetical protein